MRNRRHNCILQGYHEKWGAKCSHSPKSGQSTSRHAGRRPPATGNRPPATGMINPSIYLTMRGLGLNWSPGSSLYLGTITFSLKTKGPRVPCLWPPLGIFLAPFTLRLWEHVNWKKCLFTEIGIELVWTPPPSLRITENGQNGVGGICSKTVLKVP